MGQPTHILMHPRVHRAHRLKSAVLQLQLSWFYPLDVALQTLVHFSNMLIVFVIQKCNYKNRRSAIEVQCFLPRW